MGNTTTEYNNTTTQRGGATSSNATYSETDLKNMIPSPERLLANEEISAEMLMTLGCALDGENSPSPAKAVLMKNFDENCQLQSTGNKKIDKRKSTAKKKTNNHRRTEAALNLNLNSGKEGHCIPLGGLFVSGAGGAAKNMVVGVEAKRRLGVASEESSNHDSKKQLIQQ